MGIADPAIPGLRGLLGLLLCGALGACSGLPLLIEPSDPLTADDHFRLGSAYELRGLQDDAARQYEMALRLKPSDPEARVALGNIEFKRGNFVRAEADFRRALKASPLHAGAKNNLAMTYLRQNKKLEEAERLAQSALAQNGPLQPYILDTLANIYERERRFPEARAAAEQAALAAASRGVTLAPRSEEPLTGQGPSAPLSRRKD